MNNHGEQASPDPGRIAYLVNGFLQDNLTEPERDELDEWIEAAPENMKLFEELTDEGNLQAAQTWYQQKETDKRRKNERYRSIRKGIGPGIRSIVWYLAAACIAGLCFGIYLFTRNNTIEKPAPIAQTPTRKPEKAKVTLTLANGRKVLLDSGQRVTESGYTIENGVLAYPKAGSTDTGYNTVIVPTGNQFKIALSDGTNVWLNAGTTITFPVVFGTQQRTVVLDGEAYFEVVHDAAKPFTVQSKKQAITVLGTKFNVSAYSDDAEPVTTLVQGSVKVNAGSTAKILVPGQQSKIGNNSIEVNDVNVEEATAWKENLFLFRTAPIESVMSQLQRWYGVSIKYERRPSAHLNATVKRTESLERVLQILEGTGYVHFTLTGNKLTVKP